MEDQEKRERSDCVVVADRHQVLMQEVRTLLDMVFSTVVTVADEVSLYQATARWKPFLAVVDLSLSRAGNFHWLPRLRASSPGIKIIVTSNYDEPSVRRAALCAGVDGFVLKRRMAIDLLPTVEAVFNTDRPPFDWSQIDTPDGTRSIQSAHPKSHSHVTHPTITV